MDAIIKPADIPSIREWRGAQLSPVEEVLMYHDDTGPVPDAWRRLRAALESEGIEYVVIGAVAMAAHRFRRATEDVDICLREDDLNRFRERFVGSVYQRVEGRKRRFYDPRSQVTFDFLVSGRLAGRRDKNKDIRFPDPSEAIEMQGLRTVPLDRLIALKLVTWRLKDWVDVIALIRANTLDEQFAQNLPGVVRSAYLQCYDQMVEEDRYEKELDEE
jgi:hypothetical protein